MGIHRNEYKKDQTTTNMKHYLIKSLKELGDFMPQKTEQQTGPDISTVNITSSVPSIFLQHNNSVN